MLEMASSLQAASTSLCRVATKSAALPSRCWNSHRASIGAVTRSQYVRKFPVRLVRPDGSTIEVRAAEPLRMFALPVDLKALSEEERITLLAARKPKAKKIVQETIDDNFDASAYMSGIFGVPPPPAAATPAAPSASRAAPRKDAAKADDKKKKAK